MKIMFVPFVFIHTLLLFIVLIISEKSGCPGTIFRIKYVVVRFLNLVFSVCVFFFPS